MTNAMTEAQIKEFLSEMEAKVIHRINMYCRDKTEFCRAGGFSSWIKVGVLPNLHPNYGLPCVILAETKNCCFCGKFI